MAFVCVVGAALAAGLTMGTSDMLSRCGGNLQYLCYLQQGQFFSWSRCFSEASYTYELTIYRDVQCSLKCCSCRAVIQQFGQ